MKKTLLALALVSLLPLCAEVLFETPSSMKPRLFKGKTGSFNDQEVPVTPRTRLKLTIRARSAQGNNIESCPDQEAFLQDAVWGTGFMVRPFARIGFEFRSADGKIRKNELYSPKKILVSQTKFTDHVLEFYVPDGAAKLRVVVWPGDKTNFVEVASFRVEKVENAPTLNVNPDFRNYGPNPSGWYCYNASWAQDKKGRVSIRLGWAVGDYIPVTPGERFQISYGGGNGGEHPQAFSAAFFKDTVFSSKNAVARNKIPMRLNAKGEGAVEISVPQGAQWMRLGCREGLMHYVRVTKK